MSEEYRRIKSDFDKEYGFLSSIPQIEETPLLQELLTLDPEVLRGCFLVDLKARDLPWSFFLVGIRLWGRAVVPPEDRGKYDVICGLWIKHLEK